MNGFIVSHTRGTKRHMAYGPLARSSLWLQTNSYNNAAAEALRGERERERREGGGRRRAQKRVLQRVAAGVD